MRFAISFWIVCMYIGGVLIGFFTSAEEWSQVDRIIPLALTSIPLVLWFGLLAIADAIKGIKPKS